MSDTLIHDDDDFEAPTVKSIRVVPPKPHNPSNMTTLTSSAGTSEDSPLDAGVVPSAPEFSMKDKLKSALRVFDNNEKNHDDIKGARYHCDYCKKDITNLVRVKCAECSDFDLCVECFSVGVELRSHKNMHPYYLMEPLDFPLLARDWVVDEEMLLLEGIETLGFGNWEDIADHVGTKTKVKCRRHYMKYYVESANWPLPDLSNPVKIDEKEEQPTVEEEPDELDIDTKPAKMEVNKVLPPNPTPLDLAGYMPKRQEYSTEFENDAELILADLMFNADDTPEDRLMKLRIIDIYNSKLDQRTRRKKFAKERGLLDIRKLQQKERKMCRSDRDLLAKLRPFARHQSQQENEALVQGLLEEQNLKRRIEQLKLWRSFGIHTMEAGEQFDVDYQKRQADQKIGKMKSGSGMMRSASRMSTKRENPVATVQPEAKRQAITRKAESGIKDTDLLGEKEKQLAAAVRLTGHQYLYVKDLLVSESSKHGYLSRASAKALLRMDASRAVKIYDFFVASSFINSDPSIRFPHFPPPPQPTTPASNQPTASGTPTATTATASSNGEVKSEAMEGVTATTASTSAETTSTAATTSTSNGTAMEGVEVTPSAPAAVSIKAEPAA